MVKVEEDVLQILRAENILCEAYPLYEGQLFAEGTDGTPFVSFAGINNSEAPSISSQIDRRVHFHV